MNNRLIKRNQTKLKRKSQLCRVFKLKIDKSHLSNKTLDHLYSLFREAKRYYNYVLSNDNINDAETKIKKVPVKVKDKFETRELKVLTAQMRQDIKAKTFDSLRSLKALKNNGYKTGRLKFKKRINSIPLRQYHRTFDFNFERNTIRIQGLKQKLKFRGLGQIEKDIEIANAILVNKNNDFYIHVTTYKDKEKQDTPKSSIGIDFGCETQLTFSDRTKIEFQVPASKRLKRLDRKIMKKVDNKKRPNSNNRRKDQLKRRKVYERLTNQKQDIRHKIVNAITKNFQYVCFQDESIKAWHSGGHGKKIQNSSIGGILKDLKHKSETPIEVDKFFPSTQLCPMCNRKNKLALKDRVYECECGYIEDRDVKSAKCIEKEGLEKFIPTDHRDFKLEENLSSTFFDTLSQINGVKISKTKSLSQEAAGLVLR